MGLMKPTFFGFIISTVGCYYGLSTTGGTQGVGRSTTQAVVAASVLILVVNFFVTRFIMATFAGH
jgi:phospholipid/cholesterol/gamma-HCH transport system permease protein